MPCSQPWSRPTDVLWQEAPGAGVRAGAWRYRVGVNSFDFEGVIELLQAPSSSLYNSKSTMLPRTGLTVLVLRRFSCV